MPGHVANYWFVNRDFFEKEEGILVPDDNEPAWSSSSCCLWVAPPNMKTHNSLRALYSRTLGEEQMGNIENLFRRTLEIPNASLDDLVAELHELRSVGCKDKLRMRALYKYLDKSIPATPDMRYVLIRFPPIRIACSRLTQKQSCI